MTGKIPQLPEDTAREQRERHQALVLAVEATKHFPTSKRSTLEWAEVFKKYIATGALT